MLSDWLTFKFGSIFEWWREEKKLTTYQNTYWNQNDKNIYMRIQKGFGLTLWCIVRILCCRLQRQEERCALVSIFHPNILTVKEIDRFGLIFHPSVRLPSSELADFLKVDIWRIWWKTSFMLNVSWFWNVFLVENKSTSKLWIL